MHAWVMMDNHYHLLVETGEENLSRVGQWVNVAYSVWFNRRHGRRGHLFQGRFGAVLVGEDRAWLEVARYVAPESGAGGPMGVKQGGSTATAHGGRTRSRGQTG